MVLTETDVASPLWPKEDWPALADAATTAALAAAGFTGPAGSALEISLRLTDDAEVHALNRGYRHKDKPTNILSFPMFDAPDLAALPPAGPVLLGDLVLAAETCIAEADTRGWPLAAHVQHLIVHGTLHLLGFDHETCESEADAMEALERIACAKLGLPDPYA
jgi:probable rRNA maturation factor